MGVNDVNGYPKTEGKFWLPREQELTVGLSWVLTMSNAGRLDVAA